MWKKAIGISIVLLLVALSAHADDTQAGFVSGDTQACFADEFTCNVMMGQTSGPIVFSTVVSPQAVINGSGVTLRLSGMSLTSIVATITSPNLTQQNISLTDSANTTYTATQIGTYSVIFTVIDDLNRTLSLQRSFQAFPGTPMNISIVDHTNESQNTTVQFYYNGSLIENSTVNGTFAADVVNTLLDIGFSAYGEQVILHDINVTLDSNKSFGVDKYPSPSYLVVYGVHNTFNMTDATVVIPYDTLPVTDESRLKLLKCDDYDFFSRTCNGAYVEINATRDPVRKTLTAVVHSFSGFAVKQGSAPTPAPVVSNGRRQVCYYDWDCTAWSQCSSGTKTRVCTYTGTCAEPQYSTYHPNENGNCTMPIAPPTPPPAPTTPNATENTTTPITTPTVMPTPVLNESTQENSSVVETPVETPEPPAVQLPTSTSPWSSKLLWVGLLLAAIIAMVSFVMTQMRKVETRVRAAPRAPPVTMPIAMPAKPAPPPANSMNTPAVEMTDRMPIAKPAPTTPPTTNTPNLEIASKAAEIEQLLGEKRFHEAIDIYECMRADYGKMTPAQQHELIALSHRIAEAVGLKY